MYMEEGLCGGIPQALPRLLRALTWKLPAALAVVKGGHTPRCTAQLSSMTCAQCAAGRADARRLSRCCRAQVSSTTLFLIEGNGQAGGNTAMCWGDGFISNTCARCRPCLPHALPAWCSSTRILRG